MDVLAQRLKKCRENIKKSEPEYTQSFVANKIGVARTTYTAYENGTKMPPIDTLSNIAKLFDVSIDYLTGLSNHPKLNHKEDKEVDKEVEELMQILESMPDDKRKEMEARILAYAQGLADANEE